MSLPIAATPKLNSKETTRWLRKIARDLKRPAKLIPTPKLKRAEEMIRRERYGL